MFPSRVLHGTRGLKRDYLAEHPNAGRRVLHGTRGLKPLTYEDLNNRRRRVLHGTRGLKLVRRCGVLSVLKVASFTGRVD